MIFLWRGLFYHGGESNVFVGEIAVNKEKLSETSIILHTRETIYSGKPYTLSLC